MMLGILEDKRTEFKVKLTDTLEKEVIAFLNTDVGNIKDNIMPSELFFVI